MMNQFTKRIIEICFLLVFIFSLNAQKVEKPNVVIMIADDVSRDDFGCYGHPILKTPNIDKLAKDGMIFTNTNLTASSCSPSRVSIITGRYPHNTGACELHAALPKTQVVFPKLLKDVGYYTAQAGKWHLGHSSGKPTGIALGAFNRTGGSYLDGGTDSGAGRWIEFLKERPKNKPFFMWFAAHDAHRGWDNNGTVKYTPEEVIVPVYMVDDLKTRNDLAAYYQEVSRFDMNVGRVVEELKKQGVLDNTLIIVMADNGRPFPRDKTRLYDSGILTPFIVHYPNGIDQSGQTCNSLVSVIDIAPSIVEIAGAENNPIFQGKSFLKLLNNPNETFRKYIFAEHNWHDYEAFERMVKSEEYIYIENDRPELSNIGAADVLKGAAGRSMLNGNKNGSLNEIQKQIFIIPQPKSELYNYKNDPNQLINLSENKESVSIINNLESVLDNWKSKTLDSCPEEITPDWYDRQTVKPLKIKGKRGTMPGRSFYAEKTIGIY